MGEIKNCAPENSYELVTEDLVKTALKRDKGQDAELFSFEIKPFTKKGDNYDNVVTSVLVTYRENGSENEVSYIAKLNPLRPVSSNTDLLEKMFCVETEVFSSITGGMNKILKNLNFPPVKTPKLLAQCLDKRKEAILTEDLRKQGFKMPDRMKGMDANHANLVMEELGRFHASSFLFEQTLHPKTIPESFENFKDVWDTAHESFKFFDAMMASQTENACHLLKQAGAKYKDCQKWLHNHRGEMAIFFVDGFKGNKCIEVLAHADCWTNNLLFKYDEKSKPVDLRIVDLQTARKASPASDLIFFLYSSLDGDVRRKNMDNMISLYYDSFVKVIHEDGKSPPFSYQELQEEIGSKKNFAISCSLVILPGILAEEDEIWDEDFNDDEIEELVKKQYEQFEKVAKKDIFKDRFLSIFDEMIKDKFFDHD